MKKISNMYFQGNRKKNKIALTFDDGPSKETEKVLDLLKKYNAKATFFILGKRIKAREKIIKRINKEGHEIGNHTYSHKRLWFKSKRFAKKNIKKCDKELEKTGMKTNLFRFPGFKIGYCSWLATKELNKKVIFCDVSSLDWKKKGINYSVKKVLNKTKKGSIINLHDYLQGIGKNRKIISILEKILPKLKDKYKLVTISELLEFNSS